MFAFWSPPLRSITVLAPELSSDVFHPPWLPSTSPFHFIPNITLGNSSRKEAVLLAIFTSLFSSILLNFGVNLRSNLTVGQVNTVKPLINLSLELSSWVTTSIEYFAYWQIEVKVEVKGHYLEWKGAGLLWDSLKYPCQSDGLLKLIYKIPKRLIPEIYLIQSWWILITLCSDSVVLLKTFDNDVSPHASIFIWKTQNWCGSGNKQSSHQFRLVQGINCVMLNSQDYEGSKLFLNDRITFRKCDLCM